MHININTIDTYRYILILIHNNDTIETYWYILILIHNNNTINTYQYLSIYINIKVLYSHMQYHNDTIIKTQEDFFINICTSHFIVRVRKGLLKVCVWVGAGDRTETAIFWPPLLWSSTLCLSRSPGLLNQKPRGPLCWVICYILSATSLHPNSIGGPEPLWPGVAFLTTSRL